MFYNFQISVEQLYVSHDVITLISNRLVRSKYKLCDVHFMSNRKANQSQASNLLNLSALFHSFSFLFDEKFQTWEFLRDNLVYVSPFKEKKTEAPSHTERYQVRTRRLFLDLSILNTSPCPQPLVETMQQVVPPYFYLKNQLMKKKCDCQYSLINVQLKSSFPFGPVQM